MRIFMTPALFAEAEESLGVQIENARRFPGVLDVAVTPDAHHGYGVPVGCVMATSGTLAMGPVGYDIGCGIAALRSSVSRGAATPDRVKDFSRLVMQRVGLGAGAKGQPVSKPRFEEIVRGGAEALGERRGAAERDRIPVEDSWDIPKDSRAWRGQQQLGSLGGGNHFIELQHDGDAPLGDVPHGIPRLRPRPGHALLREGAGRAGAEARADGPRLLHARLAVVALVQERGGGGRQLRDRQPPAHRPHGRGRVRGDVRRRGGDGLRDQPQPRAGGDPSRPLPPAGVDPPQGRHPRAARRPSHAGGNAVGGDRPPGDHPRVHGRLLVHPAAAARAPRAACTR